MTAGVGVEETDIFAAAAERALALLVAEYERRLNLGVEKTGPSLLHEAQHLSVDLDAAAGMRPTVRLVLSEESREEAARKLAQEMREHFGGEAKAGAAVRLARRYRDHLGNPTGARLEALLGLALPRTRLEDVPRPQQIAAHYHTGASLVWQRLREVVVSGKFRRDEETLWPHADITSASRRLCGEAIMKPRRVDSGTYMSVEERAAWADMMWSHCGQLSDWDADVFDALGAIWLSQAANAHSSAVATVDDLLWMRAVEPKVGGGGGRGGYAQDQRIPVLKALTHLENIWLTISEMEVYEQPKGKKRAERKVLAAQSRAFVVTDRVGLMRRDGVLEVGWFRFRPGDIFAHYLFGAGRQVALLSAAALAYDPHRESVEKRLAKYLSWQWKAGARGDQRQPYRVSTLLERIGQEVNLARPLRTRERLEKALDRLHADGVIAAWEYARFHNRLEDSRKGWVRRWLESTIVVEPPDAVKEAYQAASKSTAKKSVTMMEDDPFAMLEAHKKSLTLHPTVARAKKRRHELGVSQSMISERLEVSKGLIGMVERNKKPLSKVLHAKMEAWLQEVGEPAPLSEEEAMIQPVRRRTLP